MSFLLPLLHALSQAASLMQAVDLQGAWSRGLEARGDSLCDSTRCRSRSTLAHWDAEADGAGNWRFLREAAHRLSERGLHGAAFQALEHARAAGGPEDTLRLEQADELFQGGQTEAGLGLNYAVGKRYPGTREAVLRQRLLFFEDLGMKEDAEATRAQLPTTPARSARHPAVAGWYAFDLSGTRIRYAPVNSRLLELARSVQGEAILGTDGLDTLRSAGTVKEHSFGLSFSRSDGGRVLRLSPWGRIQLEAREDTLQLWGLGTRLSLEVPWGKGRALAQAGIVRTEDRSSGTRQSSSALLQWSRSDGPWPRSLSLSGALGSSVNRAATGSSRYSTAALQGRISHAPASSLRLSGSLGLSGLFSPASVTIDSFAYVVEVSGMRDTILNGSSIGGKPSWLSILDPSTGSWNWNPGMRALQSAPSTLWHGLDFEQRTPASHAGPVASLGAEWRPLSRLSLAATGNLSWQVWLERSLWNLTELGRNASTDTLVLWHNLEDGRWYLVEPLSENAFERRILPLESFSRRRRDLDLSLTLSATLELGRLGNLEGQWTMEHNWSSIDDKDSDRNVWDLRSLSLGWSLGF